MNRLTFEFVPQSDGEADDLVLQLSALDGIESVSAKQSDTSRFAAETALVIVLLGSAGLAVLARLTDWLRDRQDCLLVIDARHEDLRIEERRDIAGRRGQVVIITSGMEQVVIKRNDAVLDLQALVTRALDKSAEAAAELARSTGANASVEAPRGDI
jgi:hypothetical protein